MVDISGLKKWIYENNIEERTINNFREDFEKYKHEGKEEFSKTFPDFDISELIVQLQKISLKLGNWPECDYNHIISSVIILYKGKHIGNYDLLFNLNGEIYDEYFSIF